jgi:hypothetical protein
MILEPVRRHILLSQLDLLQSEIARLHVLEIHDELRCVHESISNIAAVIKADVENLLWSIGGLDLGDERVQFVLGILKSHRSRPIHLVEHRKTMAKSPT